MTSSKIKQLIKETHQIKDLITSYEELQQEVSDAREHTTQFAQRLGLNNTNALKNHPSVMAYLSGYMKGRYVIINAIESYLKGGSE
jgi:cell fate (sporulation/competence/biofilm development) regulator YlbF (YheA/YmcA/DUF963 family)